MRFTPASDMMALTPGKPITETIQSLEAGGITGAVDIAGVTVYETAALLPQISERQRLALVPKKGGLRKAALIIDVAEPNDAERLFTRVEGELARRYGQPSDAFSEGDFTGDVAAKITNGEVIRATEWRGPGGHYGCSFRVASMVWSALRSNGLQPSSRLTKIGLAPELMRSGKVFEGCRCPARAAADFATLGILSAIVGGGGRLGEVQSVIEHIYVQGCIACSSIVKEGAHICATTVADHEICSAEAELIGV